MKDFKFVESINHLILEIIESQNNDGGWGVEKHAVSTPVNTAQVLLSIFEYFPYRNIDFISDAINFISKTQSINNGGWKSHVVADNDIETITTTTYCIQALLKYTSENSFKKQIKKGINFILQRRKKDSLWSNTNEEEISITASIFALNTLLLCRSLNKKRIDSILFDTLSILKNIQKKDGGFGFYINDDSSSFAASLYTYKYLSELKDEIEFSDKGLLMDLEKFISTFSLKSENICEIEEKNISGKRIQYQHVNPAWILICVPPTKTIFKKLYFDSFEYLTKMFTSTGFAASPNGKSFTWSNAIAVRAIVSLMKNLRTKQLIEFYGKVSQGLNKIKINDYEFLNINSIENIYRSKEEKKAKLIVTITRIVVFLFFLVPVFLVLIYSLKNKSTDNLYNIKSWISYILAIINLIFIPFKKIWSKLEKILAERLLRKKMEVLRTLPNKR